MKIFFDSRWVAEHGIGRLAREYRDRVVRHHDVVELIEGPKPSGPLDWLFLGRRFRQSGADLLITPGYNGTPLAGSRQIFFIHDLIHFGDGEPGGFAKRLYYNQIIRRAAARGTVVTVSHASARRIAGRWPDVAPHLHVIHNGVSQAFLRVDEPNRRSGLVLFGNARWHKNLGGMLAGVASWQRRSDPDGRHPVLIVGKADAAAALADAAGVRNVRLLGVLDDEALARQLNAAAALLFCSLEEGFGLPIVEALGCGCPVVASDIPVFSEIASDGCIFVDPRSPDGIADGIERAMSCRIDAPGRAAVKARFSWDRSYDALDALIRAAQARQGRAD